MMGKLKSRLPEPRPRVRTPMRREGFVIRPSPSGPLPDAEELRGLVENRGHLISPELLMLGLQSLLED